MIDLYSRAGILEKAMDIINEMPFPPCATVWHALWGAARVHRKIELGELAAEKLISLQPEDLAAHVLLSIRNYALNICYEIYALNKKVHSISIIC
jgi:hypothetical protein